MEDVVLATGLWTPAAAMALLRARLSRHGLQPRVFAYYGRDPLEENIRRLAQFVRASCGRRPHFVGQSLGGVLMFDMLSGHPEIAAGRVVLLAAPVRGALSGRRLARHALGRWLMGGCASRWEERDAVWSRPEALGVIAGSSPIGLGRLLGALPGENDGVVSVAETTVSGMAERTLVRQGHSELPFTAPVAALVARFLLQGRFT